MAILSMVGSRCLLSAAFTTISSKILKRPGTCTGRKAGGGGKEKDHRGGQHRVVGMERQGAHVGDLALDDAARLLVKDPHGLGDLLDGPDCGMGPKASGGQSPIKFAHHERSEGTRGSGRGKAAVLNCNA